MADVHNLRQAGNISCDLLNPASEDLELAQRGEQAKCRSSAQATTHGQLVHNSQPLYPSNNSNDVRPVA